MCDGASGQDDWSSGTRSIFVELYKMKIDFWFLSEEIRALKPSASQQ